MPDNHKGLEFFQNAALRGFDDPDVANILDDALFVLDEKRKVSSAEEHIITMPAFTVDSNIDGKKYFREVKHISRWVLFYKGQLNSEFIYEVIVSFKMLTKNYRDFCPGSLLEGSAEISVMFGWDFGRNDDLINPF